MFTFLGGVIAIIVLLSIIIIRNVIHICPPNKVLVFSGRYRWIRQRMSDGTEVRKRVGYRIIKGGRGFRWPLFESVDSMDLTNMIIDVRVEEAFSRGAIPLSVHGVANIKIAGEEPTIRNAIERFLGKPKAEIIRIAQETLEGNLRGVLATMTPEQVNEDRIAFLKGLQKEADEDLARLGLVLDTLKIQNVSDKVQYLDSIGRIRTSEVKRDARIATAKNWAEAAVRDATNRKEKELLKIKVTRKTVEAEFAKRFTDAVTKREAVIAGEKGTIAALVARAAAELHLQEARYIQMKHQLEADIIRPAMAQTSADMAKADGSVALQIEEGKAQANALRAIVQSFKESGTAGKEIFILQKLDVILPNILEVLNSVHIDKLAYLPQTNEASGIGNKSARLVEEVKAATGVDISKIAKKFES
ncbi:flotillin family protein [Myxococcota bacterium]|nr:flotillin family protein [Myxococcota bacterium]MBU1380996.1 flotillin family protein [Myxococcota bacterium]MBU1496619.1 flotillin family protein [Myxococcota bacterium]